MNLNYEEVSIEEADRIIKSANLRTLAQMVSDLQVVQEVDTETPRDFARSVLLSLA